MSELLRGVLVVKNKSSQTSLFLLTIVAIVGIVAIVVMTVPTGKISTNYDGGEVNLAGEAKLIPSRAYYVDNAAKGQNTGNSWRHAWKSFADIDWDIVRPGSVIFVSGGKSSKTYYESLVIEKSGFSGSPITIMKGRDRKHNGKVIIKGSGSGNGINIRPQKYITISGFRVEGWSANVYISGQSGSTYSESGASSHIIVDKMDLYATNGRGVFVQTSDNIIVKNSVITTPNYVEAQTDGIYSQRNVDVEYKNNKIIISNEFQSAHNDGIQSYQDTNLKISNNYVEQDNNKLTNANGIYLTDTKESADVRGNVVYLPNSNTYPLIISGIGSSTPDFHVIHNTLVGGAFGSYFLKNVPISKVKYNIVVSYKNAALVARFSQSMPNPSIINYNLYFAPESIESFSLNGNNIDWNDWRASGYDINGLYINPKFINPSSGDFRLSSRSPACGSFEGESYLGAYPCKSIIRIDR